MAETILFVAVPLFAALIVYGVRDRKRMAAQILSLSEQQRELQNVVNEFMEESEKITLQFSRLIAENRNPVSDVPAAALPAPARREGETSKLKGNGLERRHMVLGLAQKGRSIREITEHLMMPSGEVELILNLNRSRRMAMRTPS